MARQQRLIKMHEKSAEALKSPEGFKDVQRPEILPEKGALVGL